MIDYKDQIKIEYWVALRNDFDFLFADECIVRKNDGKLHIIDLIVSKHKC
jgi:hypothetical protein